VAFAEESSVGQKRKREKTTEELQAEQVLAALEEVEQSGRAPKLVTENPGQFLRDMYEVWHRQGGIVGGRPRNSIRKMREQWLVGKNHVPSLHPKLMGRVKATRSDVRALVDLFLTRWRYGQTGDALTSMTTDGYVSFKATDRRRLRDAVVDGIVKHANGRRGLSLPPQADERDDIKETERRWVDVEKVMHECDALITLSRHKIAVGSSPWQTIRNVWHMLNHVFEYDESRDFPDRFFVWVVDLGSREVEQAEAFEEFYNAGLLALQLASFANFDASKGSEAENRLRLLPRLTISESVRRDELWRWLTERAVVVVQNLRLEEFSASYAEEEERLSAVRLKDVGVTAEHVLPSTTPRAWGRELRHLYGREIAAADATFTVFMRQSGWPIDEKSRHIRYFAHTPIRPQRNGGVGAKAPAEWVTRSEELKAPDANYDDAVRLLYWASRYRLERNDKETATVGWQALAYLRKLGFRALTLPDFLKIFAANA
jgi:hypothetical protein